MEEHKNKARAFYAANKKHVWVGCGFLAVLLLLIIGAVIIRVRQSPPPAATIAYTPEGFLPPTMKLLVNDQGTDVIFVNDSDQSLDISESSTNPEVFQIGIVESKNITKPKKVHLSKSGTYTFTNNKETSQTVTVEVITTEQLQSQ